MGISEDFKKGLIEAFGSLPTSEKSAFARKMRIHQGWWRAFVLAEEQGNWPNVPQKAICNCIRGGEISKINFLSENIRETVQEVLKERAVQHTKGMVNEDRLFNNLLSSQPLCFNFFGELRKDLEMAAGVLRVFIPSVSSVESVDFEWAPPKGTEDNSAFDVAIRFRAGEKKCLLGLECKLTDSLDSAEHDKLSYRNIFANSTRFKADYSELKTKKYNQLFRNELMADFLIQNQEFHKVYTGLFFHPDDRAGRTTGNEFQAMLKNGRESFLIIDYASFLQAMQQQQLTVQMREVSVLLWVRYLSTKLSDNFSRKVIST